MRPGFFFLSSVPMFFFPSLPFFLSFLLFIHRELLEEKKKEQGKEDEGKVNVLKHIWVKKRDQQEKLSTCFPYPHVSLMKQVCFVRLFKSGVPELSSRKQHWRLKEIKKSYDWCYLQERICSSKHRIFLNWKTNTVRKWKCLSPAMRTRSDAIQKWIVILRSN